MSVDTTYLPQFLIVRHILTFDIAFNTVVVLNVEGFFFFTFCSY